MKKAYSVRYHKRALKALAKMERSTSILLINWIESNLVGCLDPRFTGKPLSGSLKGKWRYRVGDFRIIAEIKDDEVLILLLNVGHRKEIYR